MPRASRLTLGLVVLLAACDRTSAVPANSTTTPHELSTPGRSGAGAASSSGGFIYVSNYSSTPSSVPPSVLIYPVGSNGNVAPSSTIVGPNTGITSPNGIVVNASGEIFVVDTGTNAILGFAPGSAGNASPNIVISGSNTGLSVPIGLAIDATGNLYVDNWGPPASVEEFSAGSTGNASPVRTITGRKTRLIDHLNGIALNSHGDIYVALAGPNAINIFGPTQNGNVKPRRLLAGPNTGIEGPDGVAIGNNKLYVANTGGPNIARFKADADGNVVPERSLQTPPALPQALGGLYSAPDGTLYVAGYGNAAIYQYAANVRPHAAPLTVISGAASELVIPTFVFVK